MTEVNSKLRFYRQSPRKVRTVIDAIRGLEVAAAEAQLSSLGKRAAAPILKLLHSAIANAEHNNKLNKEQLYIKEARVDQGPTLKRWMPRAHGRATPIRKRTSHITIVLGTKEQKEKSSEQKSGSDGKLKAVTKKENKKK